MQVQYNLPPDDELSKQYQEESIKRMEETLDNYGKVKYWYCVSHRSKAINSFEQNVEPRCISDIRGGILLPCSWELKFE